MNIISKWQPLTDILNRSAGTVAPAIVCRVEQDSKVCFEHAVGWLDPDEETRPTTPSTIFDYASLTKLFTTTACLSLIDTGSLTLETPLVEILPEFGEIKLLGGAEDPITKQPIPADPRWLSVAGSPWYDATSVTIRRLLTHTSGLPAWRSVYRSCGRVPSPSPIIRQAEQVQRAQAGLGALMAYPFVYPPGESYAYSDVGIMLLGAAVTEVSGSRSLAEAIAGLVLDPLGLSATFLPTESMTVQTAPTETCTWRGRSLIGEVHDENAAGIGGIAGHAGLFGAAEDICRLGQLYLGGGAIVLKKGESPRKILSREVVHEAIREQIHTEEGVRRGLGWMLRSEPNPSCSRSFSQDSFGHTGYTGTSLWCDPERNLSVALLTNRVYYGREPHKIAQFRPAVHEIIARILES